MNASPLFRDNVSLAPFTYYKIGGPARYFAQPQSLKDLEEISAFLKKNPIPVFILGAGSNVLIDDRGFAGLVVQHSRWDTSLHYDKTASTIACGSSVTVARLLRYTVDQGCSGLEFLAGVPGSLGGVAFMNAGTKTGDCSQVIHELRSFSLDSGQSQIIRDFSYSYRKNHFLNHLDFITHVTFKVTTSSPEKVKQTIQTLLEQRKQTQPVDLPSCGSVFKNPSPQQPAWSLIQQVGLSGRQIGGAQISPIHNNFIVNLGTATAQDVKDLIGLAKELVEKRFHILLEEEVKILPYAP